MNIPETNGPKNIIPASEIKARENSRNTLERENKTFRVDSSIGHKPDSRIREIGEQIQSAAEIRPEAVAAAKELLAAGGLTSHNSAVETAESLAGLIRSL